MWAEDVQFVPYTPPPVSESVLDHGTVEEWSERIALIDDDLKWLLSLPHTRFWCQVKYLPIIELGSVEGEELCRSSRMFGQDG